MVIFAICKKDLPVSNEILSPLGGVKKGHSDKAYISSATALHRGVSLYLWSTY